MISSAPEPSVSSGATDTSAGESVDDSASVDSLNPEKSGVLPVGLNCPDVLSVAASVADSFSDSSVGPLPLDSSGPSSPWAGASVAEPSSGMISSGANVVNSGVDSVLLIVPVTASFGV
jgi:hypothetical protein